MLAKNNPFGILAASFLLGAMRNGADLMELTSGVSKYIISLIQALVLLFVAAPAIVRWMYRIKATRRPEEEAPLTRGLGRLTHEPQQQTQLGSVGSASAARWVTPLIAVLGLIGGVVAAEPGHRRPVRRASASSDTLAQTLRVATPIAFAAFCGVMCERAGRGGHRHRRARC